MSFCTYCAGNTAGHDFGCPNHPHTGAHTHTISFGRADDHPQLIKLTVDSWTSEIIRGEIEVANMRGLYQVWIVDPEVGEVIHKSEQIASDEERARLKAVVEANAETTTDIVGHIDDYDIICRKLGDVRPKREG